MAPFDRNLNPARVQPGTPAGGQFVTDPRAESDVTLDAPPTPETDLATTQAAREEAQEQYRNAGTEEERDELSGEIEELSLRVLALDMRNQYPDAGHVVLVDSDQGDFMHVAGVLDADGKRLDDPTRDWGVEDNYTAAADLMTGSSVWGKHAVEVGLRGGERQWAVDLNAALTPVPNLEVQQTPAGELSTFIGADGVAVVQLDTNGAGRVRINVNDAPVWDGDPEADTSAREVVTSIESLLPEESVTDPQELHAAIASIRAILDGRTRA